MKLASAESAPLMLTVVPPTWVHAKVSVSPGSTPEPFNCTTEFSIAVLSPPAFAVGAEFALRAGSPPPPQAATSTSSELSRTNLIRRGFLVFNASYSMCNPSSGAPFIPIITTQAPPGQGLRCTISATKIEIRAAIRPAWRAQFNIQFSATYVLLLHPVLIESEQLSS